MALSADVFHLSGALLVVTSVIAMGETLRAVRYLNLALAGLLGITPWFANGETLSALLGSVGGLLLMVLSLPRGKVLDRYGAWDRLVA